MSDDWTLEQIEEYKKQIWNEAIEAALNEAMSDSEIFEAIRRLKK